MTLLGCSGRNAGVHGEAVVVRRFTQSDSNSSIHAKRFGIERATKLAKSTKKRCLRPSLELEGLRCWLEESSHRISLPLRVPDMGHNWWTDCGEKDREWKA